jgi:hypothetical protein
MGKNFDPSLFYKVREDSVIFSFVITCIYSFFWMHRIGQQIFVVMNL